MEALAELSVLFVLLRARVQVRTGTQPDFMCCLDEVQGRSKPFRPVSGNVPIALVAQTTSQREQSVTNRSMRSLLKFGDLCHRFGN